MTGVSIYDLLVFFAIPAFAGLALYFLCFDVKTDAYNVSITFFGIFIALLLNIQVAIFSILQRRWTSPDDPKLKDVQAKKLVERRNVLNELNANLSYLILVSCGALFLSLLFYVNEWKRGVAPALLGAIYIHFILTMVMVVKRAHLLFQKEYQNS